MGDRAICPRISTIFGTSSDVLLSVVASPCASGIPEDRAACRVLRMLEGPSILCWGDTEMRKETLALEQRKVV